MRQLLNKEHLQNFGFGFVFVRISFYDDFILGAMLKNYILERKKHISVIVTSSIYNSQKKETLNWASGGPVIITIRTLESGVSGGAI